MKIAFISDIHGNSTALEAVLNDINKNNVDEIIVLGDLCFRGSSPKESLELIRSKTEKIIKGNADAWICRGFYEGEIPISVLNAMSEELEWTKSRLDEEDIEYLKNLPELLDIKLDNGKIIKAFHALPDDIFEIVNPNDSDDIIKEKIINKVNADIYVYGHIHKPFIRYIDGKCIINTGSVGLPFDGVPKASYLIINIENNDYEICFKKVEYEIEKEVQELKESRYPNLDIAQILISGKL